MNEPHLSLSQDKRTTEELLQAALSRQDEDAAGRAISALHFRATREVFDAARTLTLRETSHERAVGALILGQLGVPERSYPEEQYQCLVDLIVREQDAEVLSAVCIALGHIDDRRALPLVLPLKDHSDEDVRFAVAFALGCWEADESICALISLSRDVSPNVRDWATFALGALYNSDIPDIRAALFERLEDDEPDVQFEGLAGLAKRHDERILDRLVDDMAADRYTDYHELCEGLKAMYGRYNGDPHKLKAALARCDDA